jgi:ABC-type transport system involved in multi-copper enzyme maturation permease subunit
MNWFALRQHRKQFVVFGILLALFAALLIPTGINYWHQYQHALTTCASNPNTPSCSNLTDSLFTSSSDGLVRIGAVLGTFGLPLLMGLFLGAPLIAREYEAGTDQLAWTQGVSRRKWLSIKLLWALGFALLYGIALSLLITWWSRTLNAMTHYRFIQGHFETQGLMPVAYSMFFTAVGFMTGAWFRKTLGAFAVTFGVFVVCMASFANWIRPHYMTPVTVTSQVAPGAIDSKIPAGAWILKRGDLLNKNGQEVSFDLPNFPAECQKLTQDIRVPNGGHIAKLKAAGVDPVVDCLNRYGFHQVAKYQPPYRYWDFQRIEAGIYLGMSALVVGATYWLVLRRDA